jgi:Zn-dependent protease with chaperone function
VLRIAIAVLLLPLVAACHPHAARRLAAGPEASLDAARLERIAHAAERAAPIGLPGGFLQVRLSSRHEIGAWAWGDGRIQVSRALADLLDDDELAAAVAHELGHLLAGGELPGYPAALAGAGEPSEPEERADRLGCRLLAARGIDPLAMARMLRKIDRTYADGPDARGPFAERADRAVAACAAAS